VIHPRPRGGAASPGAGAQLREVRAAAGARVAELVGQGVLRRYPRCPVCGGTRRLPAADSGADNRYLRAIPRIAPIRLPEVLELLRPYRCCDCSAVWCDPWLSRRVAGRLYTTGFGQHNGGWQIFHASVSGADVETHAYWQERTWWRIREVCGPVRRHVELNCPFSGLLTYFRRREVGLPEYRRRARRAVREVRARRPYPKGLGSAVRRVLDPRPEPKRVAPERGDPELPRERVLVVEPSAACWGANCISRGVSCQSLAPALLAAERIPLREVEDEGAPFDVAVLSKLDHFLDPMPLLDRFLDLAELVVVAGHHPNRFTKQHPFAFGGRTREFLEARGCRVLDATAETVHPAKRDVNQCLFVSRRRTIRGRG
jgi:hypothetical protein